MDKIYDKAWKLLADPSRWCKRDEAQDFAGDFVYSESPRAMSWCAVGAIQKVYPLLREREEIFFRLKNGLNYHSIPGWNDAPETTHTEVVEMLRKLDI